MRARSRGATSRQSEHRYSFSVTAPGSRSRREAVRRSLFFTDGIASAVEQAQAAVGAKNVSIAGGGLAVQDLAFDSGVRAVAR